MSKVLLMDIGSTFTKLTAVCLKTQTILGTSMGYTTVETDINTGVDFAISDLKNKGCDYSFDKIYASSSAAGGLKMMACGLVPELTAKAAKFASLGAGAKVVKVYSYQLTDSDIKEIDENSPDIFLLSGGTDGGNSEYILHNASMLAKCEKDFPIIYAGNRSCCDACIDILSGKEVVPVSNVMPSLGQIDIVPTQSVIRQIFMDRIVHAKGINKISQMISGDIVPTPAAIFQAVQLLSGGTDTESGIGELMCVDLGGATTDTYSVAKGEPKDLRTVLKGLPEPYAKRTVEGDMGMRYSIHGIVDAVGINKIAELADLKVDEAEKLLDHLTKNTDQIPDSEKLEKLDKALATCAVKVAVERHSGTLEQTFTPMGEVYVQTGKDLRDVDKMVLTGGALIHSKSPLSIVKSALEKNVLVMSLKPDHADVYLDKKYILSAMGLLSQEDPDIALRIMKKELTCYGT